MALYTDDTSTDDSGSTSGDYDWLDVSDDEEDTDSTTSDDGLDSSGYYSDRYGGDGGDTEDTDSDYYGTETVDEDTDQYTSDSESRDLDNQDGMLDDGDDTEDYGGLMQQDGTLDYGNDDTGWSYENDGDDLEQDDPVTGTTWSATGVDGEMEGDQSEIRDEDTETVSEDVEEKRDTVWQDITGDEDTTADEEVVGPGDIDYEKSVEDTWNAATPDGIPEEVPEVPNIPDPRNSDTWLPWWAGEALVTGIAVVVLGVLGYIFRPLMSVFANTTEN